jgi:DNA repair exonuclease SbcCD ATPase subunit
MRILCLADIHIHNYSSYSQIMDDGTPSRLKQYYTLADDLSVYAHVNGIKQIIIAGDLVQSCTASPMVLNAAQYFLDILGLASEYPLMVINGNHDIDQKSGNNNELHSIVTPLVSDNQNILYEPDEGIHEVNGITFFLKSWKPKEDGYSGLKPADIAILHNPIKGCKDVTGYEFKNGFEVEELWKNYKIAVVGDIHNPQTFVDTRSGHIAVIPGQPIGQNFSSNLGSFIVIDTDDYSVTSIDTRQLEHASEYHYFRNNQDSDLKELKSYPNTHYKNKIVTSKKDKKSVTTKKLSLIDSIFSHIDSSPVEFKTEIKKKIGDIYEVVRNNYKLNTPNKVNFVHVSAENFLSIQDKVTFKFPDTGEILVHGKNGDGKTTWVEAFYWCLTGSLSKDLEVAEITNDKSAKDSVIVETVLNVSGEDIRIIRTRQTGSLLTLFKNESNITKASVVETQKLIYEILGFGKEEVDSMIYFSLNDTQLFTSLNINAQLEFISRFAQVEILDELKNQYKVLVTDLNTELTTTNAKVSLLETQAQSLRDKIEAVNYSKLANEQDIVPDKLDVNALKSQLIVLEEDREKALNLSTELQESIVSLNGQKGNQIELARQDRTVHTKIQDNKTKLQELLDKKASLSKGVCFTCQQHLPVDSKLLDEINLEIKQVADRTKALAVYVNKADEAVILHVEQELSLINDRVSKNKLHLLAINKDVNDCKNKIKEAESINQAKPDYDVETRVLTEQLNTILDDLNSYNVSELKNRITAYTLASKFLDKTNKNPVYTSFIIDTYNHFLSIVNKLFEPIGFVASITKNYKLTIKTDSGKERSIQALSGGEKRLVDVVIIIALSLAYQEMYGLESSLIGITVFDEVLTYLSESNMQYAHSVICEHLPGTKIIISNDSSLTSLFTSTIKVTKDKEKGSQYEFNL